jgi:hypothetical protein
MSDDERSAFDNLILMCPNHHARVDRLEASNYSIEFLTRIKAISSDRVDSWCSEEDLSEAASRLLIKMEIQWSLEDQAKPVAPISINYVEITRGIGQIDIENESREVLLDVNVDLVDMFSDVEVDRRPARVDELKPGSGIGFPTTRCHVGPPELIVIARCRNSSGIECEKRRHFRLSVDEADFRSRFSPR